MAKKSRADKRFGFYLKEALKDKGLSQRRLSKLTGIPYPMVIRLGKGRANPNWKTVVRIALAMEVEPSVFYYQRWAKPPDAQS